MPSASIPFACIKCSASNQFQPHEDELLFGGGDMAVGDSRPVRAVQNRTFIVRCSACDHANRVTVEWESA